jgi:hypothetical protein
MILAPFPWISFVFSLFLVCGLRKGGVRPGTLRQMLAKQYPISPLFPKNTRFVYGVLSCFYLDSAQAA